MKNIILILCLCSIFLTKGNGQNVTIFDTTNSNMTDPDLWSIAVDSRGNKWMGTSKNGLFIFDGKDFTAFNQDTSTIRGKHVEPIFKDSKDNLWVVFSAYPHTDIARYDGTQWTVLNPDDIGIKKNDFEIIDICEDKNGVIYFTGISGLLLIFKDGSWSTLKLPKKNMVALNVDVNDKGDIALSMAETDGEPDYGLLVYKNGKWEKYSEKKSPLVINSVQAVKYMDDGSLIIGYGGGFGDGGFSVMKDGKWKHFNKSNSGISDHMVRDIEYDGKYYWMATNNGLVKFDGKNVTPVFFREGKYKNVIMDIAIEDGTLWIATNFGLIRYIP